MIILYQTWGGQNVLVLKLTGVGHHLQSTVGYSTVTNTSCYEVSQHNKWIVINVALNTLLA